MLDEAKTLGFTPNDYTIMPFDGGFSGGSAQVTALQDFNAQLVSTFGWSSSVAYAHEGFSGMNGRTDDAEYFYQSDFQTVLSFAQSVGLGRYTFWSVNRDRECNPPDNNGDLSSECSSVTQNPWDFTAYTVAFANSAPVTEPSPSPSPSTPRRRHPRRRRADVAWLLHGRRLVIERDLHLRRRRVLRRRPVDRQPVELRRGSRRRVGRVEQRRRLLTAGQPRCPGRRRPRAPLAAGIKLLWGVLLVPRTTDSPTPGRKFVYWK